MKVNSSGNRYSGTAHAFQRSIDEPDEPDEGPVSSTPQRHLVSPVSLVGERTYQRELFVYHQQDLARRALHLGSPGAARAALRALYGVDFVDSKSATEHLGVLRDPTSPQDEVMQALRALVQLTPVGDDQRRLTTERMKVLRRDDVPFDDE